MIDYSVGSGWSRISFIFRFHGSVFGQAFLVAVPSAALSSLLTWFRRNSDIEVFKTSVLERQAAWTAFGSLVGFVVVFRSSQSYGRFWDGCEAIYSMRAEWFNAASSLTAFTSGSPAPKELVWQFRHALMRLFSIIHAAALCDLDSCNSPEESNLYETIEIIGLNGLDPQSLQTFQKSHCKVGLVFHWIQQLVVENIANKVMAAAPPIVTRAFQEAASGMVSYHEAMAIATVPIPFPYAQSTQLLLMVHWIIMPIVVSVWVDQPGWAFVFCWMQVFILWSLNAIAIELENPFGQDANDFDACYLQQILNQSLLLLLDPKVDKLPELVRGSIMDGQQINRMVSVKAPQLDRKFCRTLSSFGDILAQLDDPRQSQMSTDSAQSARGLSEGETFHDNVSDSVCSSRTGSRQSASWSASASGSSSAFGGGSLRDAAKKNASVLEGISENGVPDEVTYAERANQAKEDRQVVFRDSRVSDISYEEDLGNNDVTLDMLVNSLDPTRKGRVRAELMRIISEAGGVLSKEDNDDLSHEPTSLTDFSFPA